jgi:hypothetical protein
MSRHVIRGTSGGGGHHRDRAADRARRKSPASALTGHVDYIELAERMGQGVTVEDVTAYAPAPPRRRKADER